jgi:hypothetical protein
MLAGWSAIAAAILTVTGLIALLAYFGTGSPLLGRLNDLNTTLMALATMPLALALHPLASRASGALATAAVGADVVGVLLAVGFSALLLLRVMTWDAARTVITVGNGLIGVWLLMTAALALSTALLPAGLGWLGIAGGAGMAVAALGFPVLSRDHAAIFLAGAVALIGLVGFFAWAGVLLLQARLVVGGE